MSFSHIVAMTPKLVIGSQGKMPWHIKEDLQRFKRLTQHHTVIMGRKTFESIGRPLPNRRNLVVSRSKLNLPGVELVPDISHAIGLCSPDQETFIIGGAEIYKQTLDVIDRIYLTLVFSDYAGDTFYPEISTSMVVEQAIDGNGYAFIDLVKQDENKKNSDSKMTIKVTQEELTTYLKATRI